MQQNTQPCFAVLSMSLEKTCGNKMGTIIVAGGWAKYVRAETRQPVNGVCCLKETCAN